MKFWQDMADAAGDLTDRILMLGNPTKGLPERISLKNLVASIRSLWISQVVGTATDKSPSESTISNLLSPKFNIVSNGAAFSNTNYWTLWQASAGIGEVMLHNDEEKPVIVLKRLKDGALTFRQTSFKRFSFDKNKKYTIVMRVKTTKAKSIGIRIESDGGTNTVQAGLSFDTVKTWTDIKYDFIPQSSGISPLLLISCPDIQEVSISHLTIKEAADSWEDCLTNNYL